MDLLKVDQKRLQDIYKSYNTNENEINKKIEILEEWMKKQPHLPQKLPYNRFLEQMLKNNKYRTEQTKERIDSYFTLKALNLQIFQGLASNDSIFPSQTSIGIGIAPIFLENNQNLLFLIIKSPDSELFDFDKFLQSILAFPEVYLRYNNAASIRFVIEMENFSLGHLKKVNFVKYRNVLKLILDGYGYRIAGIDFLNLPIYCNPILALIKSISSAKMIARIKVHDNFKSLHKDIPEHVLPEELGGIAKYTLKQITDIGELILQNQRHFIADSVNYVSNEKLRIGKSKYDDMFGVDGTFKQMDID